MLFHHLLLITSGNIAVSSNPHRSEMVLDLVNRITKNLGSQVFGDKPVNAFSDAEMTSLNVDLLVLLLNASDVSDSTRSMAFQLGCYEVANKISLLLSCRFLNATCSCTCYAMLLFASKLQSARLRRFPQ